MSFQLNLTPEDIERLVKDSIMKSGFGAAVEKAVQNVLNSSYNNPIQEEVKKYVAAVVRDLVREKLGDSIKVSVTKYLEEKFTQDTYDSITRVALDRIVKSSDSY